MLGPDPASLSAAARVIGDAVFEAAAACEAWIGRGDKIAADAAAVSAMRRQLRSSPLRFTVAIGEGELDRAPAFARGEEIGSSAGDGWDLAVDPLEGTTLCAKGLPGALTVMAAAPRGALLSAPDGYMRKVIVGPACPAQLVHVDAPVAELLRACAAAAHKPLPEVVVCVLDRPRNAATIDEVRRAGARLHLIADGDVPAALWVCRPDDFGVDLYLGIGGAPEGVLSAAAVQCLGGQMSARLEPEDGDDRARLVSAGVADIDKALTLGELVGNDVAFAMASVTGSPGLRPATRAGERIEVEGFVWNSLALPGRRVEACSRTVDPH
jgi:fructose-1,6-bisphosphatase II / sedoheptulose-1,7-bisphosphatase